MTTQERINLLAEAALRSAPSATPPKPVTFMPSFEKLRSPEFVFPGEIAPVAQPQQAPQDVSAPEIR